MKYKINVKEVIKINNYNKINKKVVVSLSFLTIVCIAMAFITYASVYKDINFYKNAKHVTGLIKNIQEKENGHNLVRVAYTVNKRTYMKDLELTKEELGSMGIGDSLDVFYNSKKPSDCKNTTRTVGSIYLSILILLGVGIISIIVNIKYYKRIKSNIKLIEEDNYILSNFYRIEFKKPIIPTSSSKINYVYCKGEIDGEKKIFKSFGFKYKAKPLNDSSIIKVYVDKNNIDNYLVSLEDIIEE